jgi:tetratricopeptide (TPR) repeat protein
MKPTTLLWCATIVAACANISRPTAAEADQLAAARSLMATDPVGALDLAEKVLRENPGLREARLLAAECSYRIAKDGTLGNAELYFTDAIANFTKALAGLTDDAHPEALRMQAECHYELREYETGSDLAARAASAFVSRPGAENRAAAAEARLIGARCDYRRFVALRQAEMDSGKSNPNGVPAIGKDTAALAARTAAGLKEARDHHPREATLQLAAVNQWLGQSSEVVRVLEAGILRHPDETQIHDTFITWMAESGQTDSLLGAYARFVREQPSTPILRWHQGRAIYTRADQLRREGNFQGALTTYERARGAFAQYASMQPQHRDSAHQWLALCDLSMARCAVDSGDTRSAQQLVLRAGATSPLATTYVDGQPSLVDSFGNHFTGAVFAVNSALVQATEGGLSASLAFNEAVLTAHPDLFGFVYNNAALAARDLGVQKANGGDHAAAKDLWERSYRFYEKAVELSPDDARIVNDCGLMLIYHLDRDLDRARQLFERAIAIGTQQLGELPADVDPRTRELLEEAVGDAWQNIAVLLREHRKAPFADYRQFCEQAVKYFPYQRREAAALLRNQGELDLNSTARAALAQRLAQQSGDQGGAAEALAKKLPAVRQKADAGDFDGALALLDEIVKECNEHAPYHFLRGEMTLKLANQARDNRRSGVALFYEDAVRALQRSLELDAEPAAVWQLLAEAQYEAGETAAAAQTASALLLHLQSQGGGKPGEALAAHKLRANAAARAYATAKGDGKDDKDLLTAARASFRVLEQDGQLDATMLQLWSATELWAEAPAEAVNVYVRASKRFPDDLTLLDALVNTAAANRQLPLAVEALADRKDAGSLWYCGKAAFLLANDQQSLGKLDEALQALDTARAKFEASMAQNAGYRDSCEQWIAMSLGKKGNLSFAKKDFAQAETALLESIRMRPDRAAEDLGNADSTKLGILKLADHFYKKGDLGNAEAIYRIASDAASSDLDLLNNSGLFARDWGNQLEAKGKKQEAMEMYEQSYKAYRRAQQLDPENVRLCNDVALIAIHHLDRDWDLAKQWLDSAIAVGTRTLEQNPPTNVDDKQALEEAVGDCYENLALWHLKHSKDAAAAKVAAQQSQKFHPGQRRPGARRHLQAAERLLQGK